MTFRETKTLYAFKMTRSQRLTERGRVFARRSPASSGSAGSAQARSRGREPRVQMKGVAEEELEVAFARIDPLPGDQSDGQCDEREGCERRNQPCRPTRGRT